MSLENNSIDLLFIANKPSIARIVEEAGIDYFFIDLEKNGKDQRQNNMDTVKSNHCFYDIKAVRPFLKNSKLLVRINPFYEGTRDEVELAIKNGADSIMLPMFERSTEVCNFISYVNGRAETFLLVETKKAVENLPDILSLGGIDRIHIGLNDLHLQLKKKFMFELITDGTVDKIIDDIRRLRPDIKYGLGGVSRIGDGTLPATNILAYHFLRGSKSVILSRNFCDLRKVSDEEARTVLMDGVRKLRDFYSSLNSKDSRYFADVLLQTKEIVKKIAEGNHV